MDLLSVGLLLFWFWGLYDVITVDQNRVRNLPKVLWIGIVIVLPALGALLWIFLGRPPRDTTRAPQQPHAPRRPRRVATPEPETPRDVAQRVITDRRSAELDRMLEEWERTRGNESASDS